MLKAPAPVKSTCETAMVSATSAKTVTVVPGTMSSDPVAVRSVIVGATVSATGRIKFAATPTLPALSTAEAWSVTLSPGTAVDGTVKVNDTSAFGCAGSSGRVSVNVAAP